MPDDRKIPDPDEEAFAAEFPAAYNELQFRRSLLATVNPDISDDEIDGIVIIQQFVCLVRRLRRNVPELAEDCSWFLHLWDDTGCMLTSRHRGYRAFAMGHFAGLMDDLAESADGHWEQHVAGQVDLFLNDIFGGGDDD